MRYPKLVPPRLCNANVHIVFFGGLNMEGIEERIGEYSGKCNLSLKTRHTVTEDKRIITLEAVALFDGDIIPYLSNPAGEMSVKENFPLECEDRRCLETENGDIFSVCSLGKPYRIFRITKERNPDGTVNFTKVEVTK